MKIFVNKIAQNSKENDDELGDNAFAIWIQK
jgi:hypothetical protein